MKRSLDHLLVGPAEQRRRHAEFVLVLAYAKPAQKEEPPRLSFLDDHERLRWVRTEYQARCERAPAWVSRGLILRLFGRTAFGIDETVLSSRYKGTLVAQARQQTMAFASVVCGWSTIRIGTFRRDHTTVIHSIRKYRTLVEEALR